MKVSVNSYQPPTQKKKKKANTSSGEHLQHRKYDQFASSPSDLKYLLLILDICACLTSLLLLRGTLMGWYPFRPDLEHSFLWCCFCSANTNDHCVVMYQRCNLEMSQLNSTFDCPFLGDITVWDVPWVERESHEQKIVHGLGKSFVTFISEWSHPVKRAGGVRGRLALDKLKGIWS